MNRNIYDKSCYAAVTGHMGRLQTVHNIPVTAGETYSINLVGALRLSQLKRYLTLDCNVHIAAYFVKHRWVYDNWDSFIKNSLVTERGGTPTSLGTDSISSVNNMCSFLGAIPQRRGSGYSLTLPKHYLHGMQMIWNHYYRVPNNEDEITLGTIPDDLATEVGGWDRQYGYRIAKLPQYWNTGVDSTKVDATDHDEVYSGSGTLDLVDIGHIQAEYRDQVDRDWFSHRYRDIMESRWGSNGINVDVDERPELLMDSSTWLSGVDINGTDDASLGNYKGKSQGIVNFRVPPKYFNEHGMIWVVMALRFPSILAEECHYDTCHTLTADNFLGYPDAVRRFPPHELQRKDFVGVMGSNDTDTFGMHPYGQKFRTLNNRIHPDFIDKEGYPFEQNEDITSFWDVYKTTLMDMSDPGEATRAYFTNDDLGHWNLVSKMEIECRSPIPTARESLYAGASL